MREDKPRPFGVPKSRAVAHAEAKAAGRVGVKERENVEAAVFSPCPEAA